MKMNIPYIELMKEKEIARSLCYLIELDEENWQKFYGDFIDSKYFSEISFKNHFFIYRIASIAVILSSIENEEIFAIFKDLITEIAIQRLHCTEDYLEDQIEEASQKLFSLFFTDRETNPALSLTWAQDWLNQIGIVENNPATLIKLSYLFANAFKSDNKIFADIKKVYE